MYLKLLWFFELIKFFVGDDMKILTTFFCTLFMFQLFAYDTTGCSPLVSKTISRVTAKGASLVLTSFKSPRNDCWNKASSGFKIAYSWSQNVSTSQYTQVGFWIKVNDIDFYLNSNTTKCIINNSLHYSHNTSGEQEYRCTASLFYLVGDTEVWDIEIAPQIDGSWDTAGYSNNYKFSF